MGKDSRSTKQGKYSFEGFVEFEPDDTVVEIGAYVGEFTTEIATHVDEVVSVEPTPGAVTCLERNTRRFDNVRIVPAAVGDHTGLTVFRFGTNYANNSTIDVNDGDSGIRLEVPIFQLGDLATEMDLSVIDFLKVEAEGAEPEVLDDLDNVDVRKIAVDCSPERYGESPIEDVVEQLEANGFDVRRSNFMVYGRLA